MTDETTVQNGFSVLRGTLAKRLKAPIPHVTFWVYLLVGVIFYGGLAIWLELGIYILANEGASSDHLRVALTTFSPTLVGAVSTQLIFEEAGRDKRMMAFAFGVGVIFFLAGMGLTLIPAIPNELAIPIALFFFILAVILWWVANGFNPAFQDDLISDAALGGPPSNTPNGDLSGFKT